MFSILLAGVSIGIDHRYAFVRKQCADYFTSETPQFTVSAGEKELAEEFSKCTEELKKTVPDLMGYCESVCLYRKICLELPRYNAFLFHSAAVKQGDSAYIFSAPSGTGKSTHLRLWMRRFGKELAVINGDKPILRLSQEGTFRVYGTPWAGKEGWQNNISGELRGICFLEQSPQNRIRRLTPEEGSSRALQQILFPKEPALLAEMLKLTDRLLFSAPLYLLSCNISEEAAELSFRTLTGIQT